MGYHKNSIASKVRAYIALHPEAKAKQIVTDVKGATVVMVYKQRADLRKQAAEKKPDIYFEPVAPAPTPLPAVDMVNHPPHYKSGGIETIDFIKAKLTPEEYSGYLKGNIIKYSSRLGLKGEAAEDAGKLAWYANRLEKHIIAFHEKYISKKP